MFYRLTLLIMLAVTPKLLAGEKSIEYIGDALAVAIPASAYGATFYLHDEEGRMQFYKSIASASAVTFTLKYTVRRERPDGSDDLSFPSAHTMFAFQGATFIQMRYGFRYAVPAYLGAIFVGYSRIQADKHYLGDVVAGAAIGALGSWFFTEPYPNMTLRPMAAAGSYGLQLSYRW